MRIVLKYAFIVTFLCLFPSLSQADTNSELSTTPVTQQEAYIFLGTEFAWNIPLSYRYIDIYFQGVRKETSLYNSLQKLVYIWAISNKNIKIAPKKPMNALLFYSIVDQIKGSSLVSKENKSELLKTDLVVEDLIQLKLWHHEYNATSSQNAFSLWDIDQEKLQILLDVYRTLLNDHLKSEDLIWEELWYASLEWMASGAQDQYTVFFPPQDSSDFIESLSGEFEGIWAYIDMEKPWVLKIISPISGSPAEASGLKWWDQIISINGKDITKDMTSLQAASLIKWPAGTSVELWILRGENTMQISVIRQKIIIKDVEYDQLQNGYFYIQIKSFWEKVEREFVETLKELEKSWRKKLIIDLRNNPGWYLDQVTNILSMLVPEWEPTAIIKYKHFEYIYPSSWPLMIDLSNYEVHILINSWTASASEIMAGTLKDYFPHISLVGETTYGKGSVQTLRDYSDGSSLKYTIAKWLTGKSRTQIDQVWIAPDIEIWLDENIRHDAQLDYIINPIR